MLFRSSMDGDVAPMAELSALAKKYDAWLMADDAHGFGIIPEMQVSTAREVPSPIGGGLGWGHPRHNVPVQPPSISPLRGEGQPPYHNYADIWMGTLSKSVGAYGGYVAADQSVIDYLVSSARSFMFSTGLPPSVCASALKALEIMEAEPERGARALELARRIRPDAQSTIVPIILGDEAKALEAAETLKADIVLPRHVNPPEGYGGPNHFECWMRDPDGYLVVIASPDGTAGNGWQPPKRGLG